MPLVIRLPAVTRQVWEKNDNSPINLEVYHQGFLALRKSRKEVYSGNISSRFRFMTGQNSAEISMLSPITPLHFMITSYIF